jgi:hypothetical protein
MTSNDIVTLGVVLCIVLVVAFVNSPGKEWKP